MADKPKHDHGLKWTRENRELIAAAVNEAWGIVRAMPTPRHAGAVVAGLHAMLIEADTSDAAQQQAILKEHAEAVTETITLRERNGNKLN
jgi:hypothetical protein